ncbi:MAG: DNA polymerase III subunit gamma/tau C-terminal domain-containing protein, partial [Pseudomonadota bacterium]|nr:DNA polymerase III subunit gamma/tau C-terminal domain-containing protein [Pseudomonadota bacterium]
IISRRDINLAPSERAGFEMAMIRMLAFKPMHDRDMVKSKSKKNPGKSEAKEETAQDITEESSQNNSELDQRLSQKQNQEDLVWSDLINKINLNGTTKILADNCAFIRKEDNTIYLNLDERSVSYNSKERQEILSDCLTEYFGETIEIDIDVGSPDKETPSQENLRKEKEKLVAAKKGLETDPKVKEIEDIFGGATFDPDSVVLKD